MSKKKRSSVTVLCVQLVNAFQDFKDHQEHTSFRIYGVYYSLQLRNAHIMENCAGSQ